MVVNDFPHRTEPMLQIELCMLRNSKIKYVTKSSAEQNKACHYCDNTHKFLRHVRQPSSEFWNFEWAVLGFLTWELAYVRCPKELLVCLWHEASHVSSWARLHGMMVQCHIRVVRWTVVCLLSVGLSFRCFVCWTVVLLRLLDLSNLTLLHHQRSGTYSPGVVSMWPSW